MFELDRFLISDTQLSETVDAVLDCHRSVEKPAFAEPSAFSFKPRALQARSNWYYRLERDADNFFLHRRTEIDSLRNDHAKMFNTLHQNDFVDMFARGPCILHESRSLDARLGVPKLVIGQRRRTARDARNERRCRDGDTWSEPRCRDGGPQSGASHPAHAGRRCKRAACLPRRRRLHYHLPHRRHLLSRAVRLFATDEPDVSRSFGIAFVPRVWARSPLPRGRLRGNETLRTALREGPMHRVETTGGCVTLAPRDLAASPHRSRCCRSDSHRCNRRGRRPRRFQTRPRSGPELGLSPKPSAATPIRLSTEVQSW